VQEKTLADESARVIGHVYEKTVGSRSLEGNDRSDHIGLESSNISILKRSYKDLLIVNKLNMKKHNGSRRL